MTGRVIQVSVSSGGVPKRAVDSAWVGRLGLTGDRHREDTVHGGPMRAVCLLGAEVIGRLRAEGHPVVAGGVGENLTTTSIDWSTQPAGTRIRVGEQLLLELTLPAMPCDTQRPNFRDGLVNRISIALHPADSRMYARVLVEGEVRPGDPIELLPADPASDAPLLDTLARHESATRRGFLALWRAAQAAGFGVRIHEDGELLIGASPDLRGHLYNNAVGLRTLPQLLPRVLDHIRAAGVPGLVESDVAPWPDAQEGSGRAVLAVAATAIPEAAPPADVTIRAVTADEWPLVQRPLSADRVAAGKDAAGAASARILPHLLSERGVTAFVAEEAGASVASGMLVRHRKVGGLMMGVVHPEARGRGIQRSLIAARAAAARADGCDLLAVDAVRDSISERNLRAMGFERLRVARTWRFDPAHDPAPHLTER